MRRLLALAALLALLAPLAPAPASGADGEDGEGWAYDLANDIMSPYCPGRTLAECPSRQADSLRMYLLTQEAAGRTRAELEQELIARFGERILAAPRPEGFGLAAYVVPVVVAVLGGALLAFFLRRQTGGTAAPEPAPARPPSSDPELERLVDEELSR